MDSTGSSKGQMGVGLSMSGFNIRLCLLNHGIFIAGTQGVGDELIWWVTSLAWPAHCTDTHALGLGH